jgi:hypothetical protein
MQIILFNLHSSFYVIQFLVCFVVVFPCIIIVFEGSILKLGLSRDKVVVLPVASGKFLHSHAEVRAGYRQASLTPDFCIPAHVFLL